MLYFLLFFFVKEKENILSFFVVVVFEYFCCLLTKMGSNFYYGVKEAEFNFSFSEAEWLTPNEVIYKMRYCISGYYQDFNLLIHPSELIVSESSQIIDVLLLAKYRNTFGNLKLKSVLLSQLINAVSNPSLNTIKNLLILKLPQDSFHWCKVNNTAIIPKFALRAGYDFVNRQFSYIGRMKVSSILFNGQITPIIETNSLETTLTSLIGTLCHIYEYIPAIVLQVHDLSYLDLTNKNESSQQFAFIKSFWSRLRSTHKNNTDFNFVSSNYEVLCLKKQPAKLKQLCINRLNEFEENFNSNCSNQRENALFKSLKFLPNSTRNLLWPSFLTPGQCLLKNSKMRSSNDIYELSLTKLGSLRMSKFYKNDTSTIFKQQCTFEKNVETLLISQTGVFLVYDNNQPMRKPKILYDHVLKFTYNDFAQDYSINDKLLNTSISNCYLLELCDTGYLRVIIQPTKLNSQLSFNRPYIKNLLNLNDFFSHEKIISTENSNSFTNYPENCSNKLQSIATITNTSENTSFYINVKLVLTDPRYMIQLPVRIITVVITVIKTLVHNLVNRFPFYLN